MNKNISTKDLSYLEDIFTWNYNYYKNSSNMLENISSKEDKEVIKKVVSFFYDNMNNVLSFLGGQNA